MNIGRLIASLGLDNREFVRGMQEAERQMQTSSAQMQSSMQRVGESMQKTGRQMKSVGKSMSMYITAPLTLLGGLMLNTAAKFEKGMNQVAAVSGATGKELQALEDIAREMGATTKFSAVEAAGGLNFLAMAGFSVQESIDALPHALSLAAAGNMELAESADIVSNVMQGFAIPAAETERVVDSLTKAFISANTNLQELGYAMSYAAPMAKTYGIALEETTAAVGFLSDAGIKGGRAGTGFRMVIAQLADKAQDLGLNIFNASGQMKSMAEVLEEVERSGIPTTEMVAALGMRAGPAFAVLMDRGSKALKEFTAEIEDAGGTAKRVAEIQMQGLQGALVELRSAWSELAIALMQQFLPMLTGLVDRLKGVVNWLSSLEESKRKWIVIIGAVLAAIGPVLIILGQFVYLLGASIKALAMKTVALKAFNAIKIAAIKLQMAWNAAMWANPIGVFIGLIAVAAAGLYAYNRAMRRTNDLQQAHNRVIRETNKETNKVATEIDILRRIVENNNIALDQRREALEKLQEIVPGYHAELTEEGRLIKHNTKTLDAYVESFRKTIEARLQESELKAFMEAEVDAADKLIKARGDHARAVTELQRAEERLAMPIYELGEVSKLERRVKKYSAELLIARDNTRQFADSLATIDTKAVSDAFYLLGISVAMFGKKIKELTQDELVLLRDELEKKLFDVLWDLDQAFFQGAEASDELKESANRLRRALGLTEDQVESIVPELHGLAKEYADLLDLSDGLSQWGVGIFDDISAEIALAKAAAKDLETTFVELELTGLAFDDFDVLDTQIEATKRSIQALISAAEGKIDITLLQPFIEELKRLNTEAEKRTVKGMLDSVADGLSNVRDQAEFMSLIGEDFNTASYEISFLQGQLQTLWDSNEKGTAEWRVAWDGVIEKLNEARVAYDFTQTVDQFESQLGQMKDFAVHAGDEFKKIADEFQGYFMELNKHLANGVDFTDARVQQLLLILDDLGERFNELSFASDQWAAAKLQAAEAIGASMAELARGSDRTTNEIIGDMLRQVTAILIRQFVEMLSPPWNLILAATAPAVAAGLFSGIGMREGGRVPSGYPGDSYPALLTTGETVFPPEDLERLLRQMKQSVNMIAENAVAQMQMMQVSPVTMIPNTQTNVSYTAHALMGADRYGVIQLEGKLEGADIMISNQRSQMRRNIIQ